jgi:hypothetical protein
MYTSSMAKQSVVLDIQIALRQLNMVENCISDWFNQVQQQNHTPIGSMYAIYGNMDPINIPQSC